MNYLLMCCKIKIGLNFYATTNLCHAKESIRRDIFLILLTTLSCFKCQSQVLFTITFLSQLGLGHRPAVTDWGLKIDSLSMYVLQLRTQTDIPSLQCRLQLSFSPKHICSLHNIDPITGHVVILLQLFVKTSATSK